MTWIAQAFNATSTVETLRDTPSTLLSIDGKLAIAVQFMLNAAGAKGKAILHQINLKMQEELERNTRLLGGRQALFMVAQAYVTADNTETYLGIEHLANVAMVNNDLETFWIRWEQIHSQLPPQAILPKGLETMLYNKIRKHPDLAQPIKDYERSAIT